MTKREALAEFKRDYLPEIQRTCEQHDTSARSEGWNNFTDHLMKEKRITEKQNETWSNPY